MKKSPYCVLQYIEALRALPAEAAPEERRRLERLIEVNIGDADVLADVLGRTPVPFDNFYGDRDAETPDTGDTIQIFLSNFGQPGVSTSPIPDEIPIAPAIDYAATILSQSPAQATEETPSPAQAVEEGISPEPAPLTESLVKILVKNGKYEEALQIITELNLKNPEKSIYFADQMRFIRKVLICKSKTNT